LSVIELLGARSVDGEEIRVRRAVIRTRTCHLKKRKRNTSTILVRKEYFVKEK
jgi:hypothetical protein